MQWHKSDNGGMLWRPPLSYEIELKVTSINDYCQD